MLPAHPRRPHRARLWIGRVLRRHLRSAICLSVACGPLPAISATAQGPPVLQIRDQSLPLLSSGTPISHIWPRVDLNIIALDRSGNPISALSPANFQVLEDGIAQPVQQVSGPGSPISLALLIDSSGSTHSWRRQVTPAIAALLKGLPPGSEVAVVFFEDVAFCDVPFSPASSLNPARLQSIMEARGGTSLFDSLIATEDYFVTHARNSRRALVLITDGGEDASHTSRADAIRALQTPGAPALFVLAAPENHSAVGPSNGPRTLRTLAQAGGGLVFTAHRDGDIPALAARISSALGDLYALSYTSSYSALDGQPHSLDVRLTGNPQRLTLFGQPSFYAPESDTSP